MLQVLSYAERVSQSGTKLAATVSSRQAAMRLSLWTVGQTIMADRGLCMQLTAYSLAQAVGPTACCARAKPAVDASLM
jgi:hypothetical protein